MTTQKLNRRRIWLAGKTILYAAVVGLLLQAHPSPVPAQGSPPAPAKAAPAAPAPRIEAPAPQRAPQPAPRDSLSDVAVHRELPIDHWLTPGEFAWDDDGVPAGPTTIVVNIRGRVLSAYRGGVEVGRSSIIYGANYKPTPTGTFPILEKDADHVSRTYGGAPMPYMLRLTADGVAIHGSEIADDLATHGCIGLPREFARLLFASARVGDKVVIWKGDRVG